jgi:hypothetical protein
MAVEEVGPSAELSCGLLRSERALSSPVVTLEDTRLAEILPGNGFRSGQNQQPPLRVSPGSPGQLSVPGPPVLSSYGSPSFM